MEKCLLLSLDIFEQKFHFAEMSVEKNVSRVRGKPFSTEPITTPDQTFSIFKH